MLSVFIVYLTFFDLFSLIIRVYVEDVEDEKVLILSDEVPKEVKEDHKDYKN